MAGKLTKSLLCHVPTTRISRLNLGEGGEGVSDDVSTE